MRRTLLSATLSAALVAAVMSVAPAIAGSCDGVFCAGAAKGDITPPVTTPMWGYTARHGALSSTEFSEDKQHADIDRYDKTFVASNGIHLRLQANAFVLRDAAGTKVAVVQTDLGGLPGEVHQAVANRIGATGIDRDHLLIGATHTHQGPGGIFQYQGYALLGGDEFDPRVFDAVVGGIADAIRSADSRLVPAALGWGQIQTSGANRNRRVSNQWCANPESNCVPDPNRAGRLIPGPDSPSTNDRTLTVIRIDTTDGRPLGIISNFAAHGTIGGDENPLLSGDNQGWATRLIEDGIAAEAGVSSDGVVDALINGVAGDHSPIGSAGPADWQGAQNADYAEMEDAGHRQAPFAIEAWKALEGSLRTDVTLDARFEFLCFCGQRVEPPYLYGDDAAEPKIDKADPVWDHVAAYAVLGAGGVTLADGTSAPVPLPSQGHKVPALAGAMTNPSIVRLQVLRIGDLLFAGVPGEPTVTVGRRLRDALLALPDRAYDEVLTAGLANDYDSYFATPEEMTVHQYEGSFTLFGPQQSPLLIAELAGLASRLNAGTPVPDCARGEDPAFCATHPVHPDTSATAFAPLPLRQDPAPQIVEQPPTPVVRGDVVSLVWRGGSPNAEWRPGADRVLLQRQAVDGTWETVAGDARDTATVLRYETIGGEHRWTAQWDIPFDAATGAYRLRVEGAYAATPGTRSAYALESEGIFVFTAPLDVAADIGDEAVVVSATYGVFDPARAFRWRPATVTTGSITVSLEGGGTLVAAVDPSGATTIPLEPGETVDGVDVTDAWGNAGSA